MVFSMNPRPLARVAVRILAGGNGDRLWPLTLTRPKPLLPLGPYRIIDFTLLNCRSSGLTGGTLLTQYRHDQLQAYVSTRWNDEYQCLPPMNGVPYRGTADAVFQNLPGIIEEDPEHVLILSADHVYRMNYAKFLRWHVETNADVTISTVEFPVNQARDLGVVEVDKRFSVTGFQEKPPRPRSLPWRPGMALVSMGIYAFRMRTLVDSLYAVCGNGFGFDFGHHVLPALVGSARVSAYHFGDEVVDAPTYWHDIGTLDSYYKVAMDMAQQNLPFGFQAFGGPERTAMLHQVSSLSGNAHVSRTMLGSGVRIDEGVEVEDCVLMSGVSVGHGSKIRRAIVEEGVEIAPDSVIGWDIEQDRKRYPVSPGGVTVVSQITHLMRPIPLPVVRERTAVLRRSSAKAAGQGIARGRTRRS
jgi:glucose-1-phosphate adenylyltransferase